MPLRENRSVVDYDTEEDLRKALLSFTHADESPNVNKVDACQKDKPANDPEPLDWVLPSIDPETTEAQSMEEELHRLQILKSYLILDAEREQSFERLTGLASRVFHVPIALVSLVDLGRQWFMSNRGLGDARETPRKHAFCAHTILNKHNILIVPDATKDFRFKDNPLVTGPPNIRFYAGAPLISPEGYKLGSFCVIDSVTRPAGLSQEEQASLRDFADMTVKELVERREKLRDDINLSQLISCMAHDLMTPLTGIELSLSLLKDDGEVQKRLGEHHKELLTTAANCGDLMIRICQTAFDTLRQESSVPLRLAGGQVSGSSSVTKLVDLVNSLFMIMEPIPKTVPVAITIGEGVPGSILSDDLKLFRSSLNLISNALERTVCGMIHLRIFVQGGSTLVFECLDTGADVGNDQYQYLFQTSHSEDGSIHNLGLSSVATLINSLDGEYGFRPRSVNSDGIPVHPHQRGSIFWFSIPLLSPSGCGVSDAEGGANISVLRKPANRPLVRVPKRPIIPIIRKLSANDLRDSRSRRETSSGGDVVIQSGSGVNISSLGSSRIDLKVSAQGQEEVKNSCLNSVFDCDVDEGDSKMLAAQELLCNNDVFNRASAVARPSLALNSSRKPRALVIDDSLVLRKSVTMVLKKLGFEVTQAVNGKEGLEALQSQTFDLTLLDFLMPVMDGLDCIKQYRKWETTHRPGMRQFVYGISAHASTLDGESGIMAGMDGFQSKPITFRVLAELQKNPVLLERSKAIDTIEQAVSTPGPLVANVVEPHAGSGVSPATTPFMGHTSTLISSSRSRAVEGSDRSACSDDRPPRKKASIENYSHTEHYGMEESSIPVCLIATDVPTAKPTDVVVHLERKGWKVVVVHDGPAALRLLKMRNWDAFLIDDNIPQMSGSACISEFRLWEEQQRVNKQRNVILVCSGIPSPLAENTWVLPPTGADGVLPRPVMSPDLEHLLMQTKNESAYEIVVRQ